MDLALVIQKPGTIVNDSTNIDAGYTAELMIDLTGLGYTTVTTSVTVNDKYF